MSKTNEKDKSTKSQQVEKDTEPLYRILTDSEIKALQESKKRMLNEMRELRRKRNEEKKQNEENG